MATMRTTGPALLAALVIGGCGEEPAPEPATAPAAVLAAHGISPELRADPRLNFLLQPCARGHHFNVNTADIDAILEESLLRGYRDTLRRAREELASYPGGLDIAWRVMRRFWISPDGKNHVNNAVDVAAMSVDPRAHEMLVEALEHPMEDIRVRAVRALRRQGVREDWEAVRAALDESTPPFIVEFVRVLHELDPERTNAEILSWMETGTAEPLWPDLAPMIASTRDPELLERCRALWPKLPKGQAAPLVVALASSGDDEALTLTRVWRDDESDITLRRIVILALGRAGMHEELEPSVVTDGSHENRILAITQLTGTPGTTASSREALTAGMNDSVDAVAVACTVALAAIGDESAIERGIELLRDESPGALQNGLRVLSQGMAQDPALARRVLEVVTERYDSSSHRSLQERTLFLGAMGQIPIEPAARRLLEETAKAEGRIQDHTAVRWVTQRAGNVGEAAHPLLLEGLLAEDDIARRLDYLEALSMHGGDQAREILLDYVNGDRATPYEVLYAADRLVRIGPARTVAPVLKRATLRIQQEDVRGALQCLLWASYPGPRQEQQASLSPPREDASPTSQDR